MRKVALQYQVLAHGVEVVLRASHGHQQVDEVVEEERHEHHKRRALKPLAAQHDGREHREQYERIVGEVAHVEQFAPALLRQGAAERDAGLATHEPLVGLGKEVVEVRKVAAEVVGVGIPETQQHHGIEVA